MVYRFYTPPPPLSAFVASFWLYQSDPSDPSDPQAPSRILPSGTAQLVIDLSGDGLCLPGPVPTGRSRGAYPAVLRGVDSTSFLLENERPLFEFGVDFTPGGAYPIFAPPASALHNAQAPLDALWGAQAAYLEDQLRATPSAEAQFRLLEQALLAHAVRPLEQRPEVAFAVQAFTTIPHTRAVAQVAGQIALSHARFIQVFREEVGLTPKLFCRVRRFLAALRWTRKGQRVNWAQLAAACGYADQAHLHRDFHHFAGVSPGVYVRERHVCFPTYLTLPHQTD